MKISKFLSTMDVYSYLRHCLLFEVDVEHALKIRDMHEICRHFNMSRDRLLDILKQNLNLFIIKSKQRKSELTYYVSLIDAQLNLNEFEISSVETFSCNNLNIIINKYTYFVNVTSLLLSLKGPRIVDWLKLEKAKNLVSKYEQNFNSKAIIYKNGTGRYDGAYMHYTLVIELMSWMCPERGVDMANAAVEYITRDARTRIANQETLILELRNHVEELNKACYCQCIKDIRCHMSFDTAPVNSLQSISQEIQDGVMRVSCEFPKSIFMLFKVGKCKYYAIRTKDSMSPSTNLRLTYRSAKINKATLVYVKACKSSMRLFCKFRSLYKETFDIRYNVITLRTNNQESAMIRCLNEICE